MSKKHTVNPWWVQFGLLFELNKKKFDNWISEFEFSKHNNINIVAFILCGKGLTSSPTHHFAKIGRRNLLFKIALWTRLEKVFTFLCLDLFPFCKCMPRPNLFDSYILQESLSDLKFYQIGNRRYIQLVVKKKMFCKEVVRGLRTDWFVTVNNFALYLLGKTLAGEFLRENVSNNARCHATCKRSEKTVSVSRYWPTSYIWDFSL